ncbi:MAG: SDR family NAD(P)-dependent oxidoreductase [Phyllobacteriaceae bacterium]|nr:SDR family NAD(P)-dependent oxidoreductase [Phyllobacteriaceae bacterium]
MKHPRTWMLVADASAAKIIRQLHPDRQTGQREDDLQFSQPERKLGAIMSDRPGRSFSFGGQHRSSMEYSSDPVRERQRAFARHLKERKSGRVINIGSTLSTISIAGRTPYATSKGGILQMTRTLALEWAPYGVTVNCVMPGPFGTEMNLPILNDPRTLQSLCGADPAGGAGATWTRSAG